MRFLISMTDVEDEWDGLPAEERERVAGRHADFQAALGERFIACYGLRPSDEAATVRLHADGALSLEKGLATPSKEPVGGFYLIEADSIEEAIEWAKRGRFRPGPNEVRQLRED